MAENITLLPHPESIIRLDQFIAEHNQTSRSMCQKLIEGGHVSVNGKTITSKSHKVSPEDIIQINAPASSEPKLLGENIPLDILHEDNDIIIINKPPGMVVHPAPGHNTGTLVHAILNHCKGSLSGINGVKKPGIVHRIDRFTSGAILIAKNDQSHTHIAQQISDRSAKREYIALCEGEVFPRSGTIDRPIGRHPHNRLKMSVSLQGRSAITHYKTILSANLPGFGTISLIHCSLETGRTHQIRVHFSALRSFILNDQLYGAKANSLLPKNRQALHAYKISFLHPQSEQNMTCYAPISPDLQSIITALQSEKIIFQNPLISFGQILQS